MRTCECRIAGEGITVQNGVARRHFVSPERRRALILDQRVADWLAREAALELNPTRWSRRTYTTYVTTMDRWSSRLGIPNHRLEEIIFTEEATLRGLGTWARP
jgi:hypothetical protein